MTTNATPVEAHPVSTIIHGDALRVLKSMPDKSVDAIVTDPPYLLSSSGTTEFIGKPINVFADIKHMTRGFNLEILGEMCRVMKRTNIYLFCSRRQVPIYLNYFVTQRRCNWDLLTWHKSNPTPACGNSYLPDTEYIMFFRDKGVPLYGTYHTKRKYYVTQVNRTDKKLYDHPTVKPVEIVSNFIVNSTRPGDVVLDPFVGSGTTAATAHQLGRIGVGIELDPSHVQTARKRLVDAAKGDEAA